MTIGKSKKKKHPNNNEKVKSFLKDQKTGKKISNWKILIVEKRAFKISFFNSSNVFRNAKKYIANLFYFACL